ncbi:hypothetical protein Sj15T_09650 [Sphingobium sp. TA15]|uniref:Uncharacterized protein n=1 Tax=Sphingobium indicum (strain DSM 16413 / CCM 7287 / MTCC 6362 / UT26 / NBRC 101211 / UT26S) TaxID=452662 RepID=D4Z228_SPHIU|nr:hypothetical protein [Sphingobium indicum]BAI96660.1 hypothetical protein SJA_C1-18260 [Sphingobium indicum UT26S]BDD65944.1 hypothetical protein Sj15T_09650 [Sphingobium sp. TA15]
MRLSDELAARRRLYSMPLITAPALLVIDIPPAFAGAGLALGRYYPVIVETDDELAEFGAFLNEDRPALRPPDLLDRRPSQRDASAITFIEYAPPTNGWPWMLLCHWPRAFAAMAGTDPEMLARGAYTTETLPSQAALQSVVISFVAAFGDGVEVVVVPPVAGTAGHG